MGVGRRQPLRFAFARRERGALIEPVIVVVMVVAAVVGMTPGHDPLALVIRRSEGVGCCGEETAASAWRSLDRGENSLPAQARAKLREMSRAPANLLEPR